MKRGMRKSGKYKKKRSDRGKLRGRMQVKRDCPAKSKAAKNNINRQIYFY